MNMFIRVSNSVLHVSKFQRILKLRGRDGWDEPFGRIKIESTRSGSEGDEKPSVVMKTKRASAIFSYGPFRRPTTHPARDSF